MNILKSYILLSSLLGFTSFAVVNAQQGANKPVSMMELDFKDETNKVKWLTVNDSVMGGRSEGSSYLTEAGNRIFSGEISLKKNGGFSSVRTQGGDYDLSDYDGMTVKVRGDGRMYYFTARANNRSRIAFWYPMQTKAGEWTTFKIPFSSFYATSFGRKINGMKLDTKNINSFGLMLYDKKDGDFSIELESATVYSE